MARGNERPTVASNHLQESLGSPKISPSTLVPDGRTLLNVELEEEGIKMNPESSVRHFLCFDDGRGWRQRAELKRRAGADLGGRLSFSVRVPKYRRALHRRSEVDVTVETILCVGGRTRVLTSSQPTVISFKAAKSRRGARVTFKKLHREESYTDLQEVLEVLAEAGVQVETVSGEIEPPPLALEEQADVEELIASVPCSPLPLPFLSEGEMQALVEDLKDDLASLDPLETYRTGTVASIKRGDLIEYKAGEGAEEQWFRVMVTSKGKSTGRNRNYINLRYADGSEGGVYINHHEWRFVQMDANHQVLTGQENLKAEKDGKDEKDGVELRVEGGSGGSRGRKRASVEMFGLEDSLSNMALDLAPFLGNRVTSFSAIRV